MNIDTIATKADLAQLKDQLSQDVKAAHNDVLKWMFILGLAQCCGIIAIVIFLL